MKRLTLTLWIELNLLTWNQKKQSLQILGNYRKLIVRKSLNSLIFISFSNTESAQLIDKRYLYNLVGMETFSFVGIMSSVLIQLLDFLLDVDTVN